MDWMSEHLGLDFEDFLGSKMDPKSELKTRGAQCVKFDSRPHGSSIFEVPGWSEIDENLMQTGPQTETAPQEPKEARKIGQDRPKIGPSWGPSGSENRSQRMMQTNVPRSTVPWARTCPPDLN